MKKNKPKQNPKKYYKSKLALITFLGLFLVCLMFALSLALGSRSVSFSDIIGAFLNKQDLSLEETIVQKRIPRTIFGLLAGGALGMSGTLMQAITRNPLADPSILGVNTGASLFVVSGIAFLKINTLNSYIWVALLGAGITAVIVYSIASTGRGGTTPIKLALAGAAVSAALSSLISIVILPRDSVMETYRFWQVGSISGATWEGIYKILPFLLAGLFLGCILAPSLNAMALGDDVATGLGVKTGLIRMLGALAGVFLCGAVTALAGPIGFVGLMVPHALRLVIGSDQRALIPLSAIYGAVILLGADVLGRVISPYGNIEAGLITAFLGAPVLVIIVMKSKVRAL